MADNIAALDKLAKKLTAEFSHKAFFEGLMSIYGLTRTYIHHAWDNDPKDNCANADGSFASMVVDPKLERLDIGIQKRALFRFVKSEEDVQEQLEAAIQSPCFQNKTFKIPVVIAVSPTYVYLYNAIENEYCSFNLEDLPQYFASLEPLTAVYKKRMDISVSTEADEKACRKLVQLMDQIEYGSDQGQFDTHSLNDFMRRIVFCLFAEDTGLFEQGLFTSTLSKLTSSTGEGCEMFFKDLFQVLNTPEEQRESLKVNKALLAFPFVGGNLFSETSFIPSFDMRARNLLINCGRIEWNKISPAIFGSLFQSAMDPDKRRQFGAHYTSEQNIFKLIKPLFLDDLTHKVEDFENEYQALHASEEFRSNQAQDSKELKSITRSFNNQFKDFERRLEEFHEALSQIKIMDPACGSGNFLVVSYRELRRLEHRILKLRYPSGVIFQEDVVKVSIAQFYGIEIEDWPVEIAHLSMWLMQHQLNQELRQEFGVAPASLPLASTAHVVCANALTKDWNEVLPAEECAYIVGNPPFAGFGTTSADQKTWLQSVYPEKHQIGLADFVSGWFVKASGYMKANTKCRSAFVSTNSICQGSQVQPLWGLLLERGIFINFAYRSFLWSNEASNKAAVFCVIIGFSYQDIRPAYIFTVCLDGSIDCKECELISPYLMDEPSKTIVQKSTFSLSRNSPMILGNQPIDDGNFILSVKEGNSLIQDQKPESQYLKLFVGSAEVCSNSYRYCLWLDESKKEDWEQILFIQERLQKIAAFRVKSIRANSRAKATTPWKFEGDHAPDLALVIPRVSSERRLYVPISIVSKDTIVSDSAFFVPNPDMFDYAFLNSKIHNTWMRFTSGRLKSDYRYSKDLTYNTFVWPEIDAKRKLDLSVIGARIFDFCSDSKLTLGEINNLESMPIELKLLHAQLDDLVESYYRDQPFEDDDDRLTLLIGLYNQKVAELEQAGKSKSKKQQDAEPEPFVWQFSESDEITPWITPLNALHIMVKGSTADDNGNLTLTRDDAFNLRATEPDSERYIRRLISSESFYSSQETYCLWLHEPEHQVVAKKSKKAKSQKDESSEVVNWKQIPAIKDRVDNCKKFRLKTPEDSLAFLKRHEAFSFSKITYPPLSQARLMIPRFIKKDPDCIPLWVSKKPLVIDDSVCIVPASDTLSGAILLSRMHWVWMTATSEFDADLGEYIYSIENTYNNLIWPHVPDDVVDALEEATNKLIELTNCYSLHFGKALNLAEADDEIIDAKDRLDELVEMCYRPEPFFSDEERLEFLKQLYLKYKF